MERLKRLIKKLTPYINRTAITAIFILASALIIFVAKDYRNEELYIFKEIEDDGVDSTAVLMYAGWAKGNSEAENGTSDKLTVYVNDAGVVTEYRTNKGTVADFFAEKGIELSRYDEVVPFGKAALADGMTVLITRVDYVTQTKTETVPYDTVVKDVDTVEKGKTVTVTKGEDGFVAYTVSTKYVNGVPTTQSEIVSTESKEPVTCVKEHGIGGKFKAPDGKIYSYSYRLTVSATAYYDAYHRGMTATGHATVPGIVAVDKSVIPLHSKCYVCGKIGDFGVLKAEDVGNFRGNCIDVYFNTLAECYAFGRQTLEVYVLEVNACSTKRHTVAGTTNIGYHGADWTYTRNKNKTTNSASEKAVTEETKIEETEENGKE